MKNYDKIAQDISKLINSVVNEYEDSYNRVGNYDKELQDMLHQLELTNMKYKERAKLATKLQESRINRRKYKDITDEINSLYNFITNNRRVLDGFIKELLRVKNIDANKRSYVKRSNKDV